MWREVIDQASLRVHEGSHWLDVRGLDPGHVEISSSDAQAALPDRLRHLTGLLKAWSDGFSLELGDLDAPVQSRPGSAGAADPGVPPAREGQCVRFLTSGSSGEPVAIVKAPDLLLAEAAMLSDLYGLGPNATVVSLVSPFHIYGFLNGLLLPLLTGGAVHWLDCRQGAWNEPCCDGPIDLLVAVPALWPLVQHIVDRWPVRTLVTSGAALNAGRQAELAASAKPPERAFEIIGSTETGGIGFRRLIGGLGSTAGIMESQGTYQLLPGVQLRGDVGRMEITSLFTGHGGEWQPLSDDFEPLNVPARGGTPGGGRWYRHLGRSDRLIKVGGRRFHLDAIENKLREFLGASWHLALRHDPNPDLSHGGRITAYLEPVTQAGGQTGQAFDIASGPDRWQLRQAFKKACELPFPDEFVQVERLPRTAGGKIRYGYLRDGSGSHRPGFSEIDETGLS